MHLAIIWMKAMLAKQIDTTTLYIKRNKKNICLYIYCSGLDALRSSVVVYSQLLHDHAIKLRNKLSSFHDIFKMTIYLYIYIRYTIYLIIYL